MTELIDAFVAAYPSHVELRCAVLGVDPPSGAVRRGQTWLHEALTELLEQPFAEQRRGPLELFQEAMRFPTAALIDAGVEPMDRNAVARAALPGDLYDLAPASSQDLGEEAWRAHLRWGAEKARALRASPS